MVNGTPAWARRMPVSRAGLAAADHHGVGGGEGLGRHLVTPVDGAAVGPVEVEVLLEERDHLLVDRGDADEAHHLPEHLG